MAVVFGGQAGVLGNSDLAPYTRPNNEFVVPWGLFTAAHFALIAQVYFDRFQPDRHRLSEIAATIRNAGSVNPNAVMYGRGPYEPEDITDSALICEPFHLLDLCLATEGASAVVITSLERARDCPHKPIKILSGSSEWYRQQYINPPRYDEVGDIGKDAVSRTFAAAGLTAIDIDIYELYDINTWEVVRQFEVMGLCDEGEGVDFLHENGIGWDQKYPTNTDGGLLSFSHTGWGGPTLKFVEAVNQLQEPQHQGRSKTGDSFGYRSRVRSPIFQYGDFECGLIVSSHANFQTTDLTQEIGEDMETIRDMEPPPHIIGIHTLLTISQWTKY